MVFLSLVIKIVQVFYFFSAYEVDAYGVELIEKFLEHYDCGKCKSIFADEKNLDSHYGGCHEVKRA